MANAEKVLNGIIEYADVEVMRKLPVSGKWIMGTVIGLASTKAGNVIESLKSNAIAQMLGIVDESGDIDVDALVDAMKDAAHKYGALSVDVPLLGRMTFSENDIITLRDYIR